ncbi:S-layer homology domain-containing protein [Clostridium aminobutyricum]|uniref:S-layer homology domain-containing protein n=1 Tax=Clostridium aminobutyricum TaxID=33953 RepID=A0A939DAF5_CLOAM|nr:S-layer homology domain-containing protein [Clostridium aminobutyricum]MBN7774080.1 S-layer homology domain-containing protein [Clostridium aminobutyricum]
MLTEKIKDPFEEHSKGGILKMRKVLSFVLILALVLSSFSMAFAGSSTELKSLSDISGSTNESAIEVAYDLGIVTGNPDGTYQPTKAVTRAEFAALITRALAIPDSALAGYASTSFKDTTGYSWAVPYLAFCNSKGIMLGDGAGNAMPGKTITVNEAVTMALRAVGYTANSAELTGVWPSNYVTKAQELKLYDDVAKDATGVDKANAAQIIYNTLTVDKVSVNSDGKTEVVKKDGVAVSLLTSGLNCTVDEKVIVKDSTISESLINAAKYLGQRGNVYRNDDDEIVAFIAKDNTQLTGRFIQSGSNVKFVTTDAEKEYSFNSQTLTVGAVLLNGDDDSSDYTADVTTVGAIATGMTTPEYVLNADVSGNTIKNVWSVNKWVANGSDQVSATNIADIADDHSLLSCDFVEDDNDNIDYTQFQLAGISSISDLKADNVVYVYETTTGIRKIEVGTATAEGTVKSFKNAKDTEYTTKFAIGANTYKNAAETLNGVNGGDSITEDRVSDDVKAFLDARGFVYDFTNLTSANNFAVVERVDSGIDYQAKLMLADGTEKTFVYKKGDVGYLAADTLIGYGLNKSGEITEANKFYATGASINLSSKTVADYISISAGGIQAANFSSLTAISISMTNAKIASDCVVFTYDSVADEYDTTTIDKVEIDKLITGATILFEKKNNNTVDTAKIVALIVPEAMAKSGDKSFAVLNEKNKDSNDDGDKVWNVVGFKDGAKLNTLTDDNSDSLFNGWTAPAYRSGTGYGLSSVALYEVKTDANGVVTSTTIVTAGGNSGKYKTALALDSTAKTVEADKRNSVVIDGVRFALADKVVIYRVDKGEYKLYTGDLKDGDAVALYEIDDDADGYDVVIFGRQ